MKVGDSDSIPLIKNPKKSDNNKLNYLFLSYSDRKYLYKLLIRRGLSSNEAYKRINELIECQRELKKKLRNKNITNKQAKKEYSKLLNNLYK